MTRTIQNNEERIVIDAENNIYRERIYRDRVKPDMEAMKRIFEERSQNLTLLPVSFPVLPDGNSTTGRLFLLYNQKNPELIYGVVPINSYRYSGPMSPIKAKVESTGGEIEMAPLFTPDGGVIGGSASQHATVFVKLPTTFYWCCFLHGEGESRSTVITNNEAAVSFLPSSNTHPDGWLCEGFDDGNYYFFRKVLHHIFEKHETEKFPYNNILNFFQFMFYQYMATEANADLNHPYTKFCLQFDMEMNQVNKSKEEFLSYCPQQSMDYGNINMIPSVMNKNIYNTTDYNALNFALTCSVFGKGRHDSFCIDAERYWNEAMESDTLMKYSEATMELG